MEKMNKKELTEEIYQYITRNNKLSPEEALLYLILDTLKDMKEQEKSYWETWKKSKLIGDNQ